MKWVPFNNVTACVGLGKEETIEEEGWIRKRSLWLGKGQSTISVIIHGVSLPHKNLVTLPDPSVYMHSFFLYSVML